MQKWIAVLLEIWAHAAIIFLSLNVSYTFYPSKFFHFCTKACTHWKSWMHVKALESFFICKLCINSSSYPLYGTIWTEIKKDQTEILLPELFLQYHEIQKNNINRTPPVSSGKEKNCSIRQLRAQPATGLVWSGVISTLRTGSIIRAASV